MSLIISYLFINIFCRREKDEEFLPYTDTSDLWVYKISLWCCSFSLAVSVGAAMLLPISTISNEVFNIEDLLYSILLTVTIVVSSEGLSKG